jgi:hypothetical protein
MPSFPAFLNEININGQGERKSQNIIGYYEFRLCRILKF